MIDGKNISVKSNLRRLCGKEDSRLIFCCIMCTEEGCNSYRLLRNGLATMRLNAFGMAAEEGSIERRMLSEQNGAASCFYRMTACSQL